MRVVFDTNIFVSAFAIPGSKAEQAIFRIIEGKDTLLISKEILNELLSTLAKKFSTNIEALSRVAVSLSDMADLIESQKNLKVFKDDPDNRILECAVAGKADLIVTGDKKMLELKNFKGIKLLSLRNYLEAKIK
tara:strand:- start:321 stop:722 length:402 start_codon:yes stop_codon:yes gene_type:complete